MSTSLSEQFAIEGGGLFSATMSERGELWPPTGVARNITDSIRCDSSVSPRYQNETAMTKFHCTGYFLKNTI